MAQAGMAGPKVLSENDKSFLRDEFPLIRTATLVLVACIGLSAGLGALTYFTNESWRENQLQATSQRNDVRNRIKEARLEKSELEAYQTKFHELQRTGLVAAENRLALVESLKKSFQARGLLGLNYEFAAQRPFVLDPSVGTGSLQLRGSRMVVQLDLLHEEDLFDFFDDLKASGYYGVHKCKLALPVVKLITAMAPRATAQCSLYWITLNKANADATPK